MYTNSYTTQRQLLLLKRHLIVVKKPLIIFTAFILLGGLIVPTILNVIVETKDFESLIAFFFFCYFVGGFILTSYVFKELHSPHKSYFFLTLPASNIEKLVGAWLLTAPIYSLLYLLMAGICLFSVHLAEGVPFVFSSFFNNGLANSLLVYFLVQPIFLWGAVYFKKNNFLKTGLSLLFLGVCIAIYSTAMAQLLLGDTMISFNGEGQNDPGLLPSDFFEPYNEIFIWAVHFYMLIMAYFTLKERQL